MATKKPSKAGALRGIVGGGPRNKPRKQTQIPGTERETDEELDAAIEKLQSARVKRTKAKDQVDTATAELVDLMGSKGVTEYVAAELEAKVSIEDRTKISLKAFKIRDEVVE